MSRARLFDAVLDVTGRPITGASVAVYEPGTTTPISETLYADDTGGTTVANPLLTDAHGSYLAYLDAPRRVDLYITSVGQSPWTVPDVGLWPDPADFTTDTDLGNHTGAADPHPDYVKESLVDAKGDLIVGTAADAVARKAAGANDTILMADSAQSDGMKWAGSQTPSTQAFADAAAEGTADTYSRGDHKHAIPANPVTAHEAAADPHTGYQRESEKGSANGYAPLGAGSLVPIANLATGTPNGTKFVRDDGTLVLPSGSTPTTTRGDIIKRGASADERLAIGTVGQGLIVQDIGSGVLEPRYATRASGMAVGSTSSPTTTSTTYVDCPEMTVTLTPIGTVLIAEFAGSFSQSGLASTITIAFSLDGAAEVGILLDQQTAAAYTTIRSAIYRFSGLTPGTSYTIKLRWKVEANTGTAFGTQRYLVVHEG